MVLTMGWLLSLPTTQAVAEEPTIRAAEHENAGEHEEHGLPPGAPHLVDIGGFAITSSMVVTWVVAAAIIIFAQVATRRMKQIPDGAQNFWEWLVESLYDFLEGVVGPGLVKKTFWFFATIFIFILATNWFGLVPGVGTVGWGIGIGPFSLEHVDKPLLRGANADLNMTMAMSTLFFGCWIVWAIQANGIGGFLLHIFGPKGETEGFMKVLMIFVFLIVGVLEVVSILFRPISLSFRLYGNIFAGENMLESMATLIKEPQWLRFIASPLIPIPFYFLELLVGIVQALVFMLLTAVFTLLICQHEEGHEEQH
jgi:F-type H+-transporting ATPase subunit a